MQAPQAQAGGTVDVFAQRLSATRRGARLARRMAAYQLDVWGVPYDAPLSETVTLVVAELSANAVLHGRVPGRDFELRLLRVRETGLIRVEVADTHPVHPRRPIHRENADATRCRDGGRGLLVVEAVASRWGVRRRQGAPGKTVWAEAEPPVAPDVCRPSPQALASREPTAQMPPPQMPSPQVPSPQPASPQAAAPDAPPPNGA